MPVPYKKYEGLKAAQSGYNTATERCAALTG